MTDVNASARSRALELLEDGATYAHAARAVGAPYGRVYHWAQQAGIPRRRALADLANGEAALQRDRDRRGQLYTLLEAYRRGELTPSETAGDLAEATAMFMDHLLVKRAVERVADGDGFLTRSEEDALGLLEALVTVGRGR